MDHYICSRCICLWACFCLTNSSNSAMTMPISWVVLFCLRIHDTYFKSDPWKSYEKVQKKTQFWRYCWGSVVDLRWNPWTDSRVKRKRHAGSNPSSLAMVVSTLRVVRLVREPQYTLDNHAVMTLWWTSCILKDLAQSLEKYCCASKASIIMWGSHLFYSCSDTPSHWQVIIFCAVRNNRSSAYRFQNFHTGWLRVFAPRW